MPIRAMIVDDSAFMRRIISDMLSEIRGVEVVGVARNGKDAIDIIPKIKPDIITLDVEMPIMNGLETLKLIKSEYNIPVIMFSSNTNPEVAIEALELGAFDFIEKPIEIKMNLVELKNDLENKIKAVFSNKLDTYNNNNRISVNENSQIINRKIDAVVIGASTGGPKVLVNIIGRLPKKMKVPIFIVQHMPEGFTKSLAERMNKESNIDVLEAQDEMPIKPNTVYLAPGGYHMVLNRDVIKLNAEGKIHGVRPAVDYLFSSAAEIYKANLLGVILTGMGKDGASGMQDIKLQGGINIGQDKESCIVFGMPGNAISKGLVDKVLSIDEISDTINKLVM
ncbi:MAG: chemotaxis response regulator protein-glutamate methylesterase [Gudongella sp.]|nr:chemotaxis response regulator protein-glutamate methylesterase [Gudongella sp.]